MTDDPLVTVITPAYNLGHYLAETIDSVLAQDYPNIEYIVLDDGSQDNTREVLEHYTGRIIWESHANMGEARTVNKGFAMAKGEFIVVVNADDPVLPGMISEQVAYLQAHPDILATYPDWIVIDENSQHIEKNYAKDYDYREMVTRAWCVPGPGAVIRKRAIEIGKGRNPDYRYVTDMDFWFRIGLHGDLARIPQFLAAHRTHPTSSGVASQQRVGKEIIKYIEDLFSKGDLPPNVQAWYKKALSSAYYEAAHRFTDYSERRWYFVRSFLIAPLSWIERPRPFWVYRILFTPLIIRKAIYKLKMFLRFRKA